MSLIVTRWGHPVCHTGLEGEGGGSWRRLQRRGEGAWMAGWREGQRGDEGYRGMKRWEGDARRESHFKLTESAPQHTHTMTSVNNGLRRRLHSCLLTKFIHSSVHKMRKMLLRLIITNKMRAFGKFGVISTSFFQSAGILSLWSRTVLLQAPSSSNALISKARAQTFFLFLHLYELNEFLSKVETQCVHTVSVLVESTISCDRKWVGVGVCLTTGSAWTHLYSYFKEINT